MHDLIPQPGEGELEPRSMAECRYCGAPLRSMYYFCLACGTPYKSIEAVVTAASPRYLGEGDLIQMKAPAVAPLYWTYMGVVIGSAIFSLLLFKDDRPDLQIFLSDSVMFVTTAIVATRYWSSLRVQFARFGFNQIAALLGLLLLLPSLLINYCYHSFLDHAGAKHIMELEKLREVGVSEMTLVVIFCVMPALTEEIAFRGLIQHWLQTAIKPWRALALASFLFASLHFSIVSFPYLFGVGMLLGWVKWRTGSLYPSMLIHMLHNLIVIEYFN